MRKSFARNVLAVAALALLVGGTPAIGQIIIHPPPPGSMGVVVVEPGHTLMQLVDSGSPMDPSHPLLDIGCVFGDEGNIESIGIDPASGRIYIQIATGGYVSADTCIFQVSPVPPHPVLLINPSTGFGINERGTDLHFDPFTGLLVTQDQNPFPVAPMRIATQVPIPFGPTGTYSWVTPPLFGPGDTFGMDFSTGVGGSDVPPGDIVFTADGASNGIHSAFFGGLGHITHVPGPPPEPGDDLVIQPDGTWVHIGDFQRVITAFSPVPPHAGTPSPTGLNILDMFTGAGLNFVFGSRATVCDTTGDIYVSYSGGMGGPGIFRVDPTLTTATLILFIADPEGLHDLTLGPSTLGPGFSVYFTVHDWGAMTEEVWELTVPECVEACDPDPATQGYWHRQCLGVPESEGGIDPGRNGRGPSSPTEPNFVPDLMDCADMRLEDLGFFGETTCEGMDANPPSDPCERAMKQTTALILNVCSDRLSNSCEVDVSAYGCSSTTVGELLDELAALIMGGECKTASNCADAVNEGMGLVNPPDNNGAVTGDLDKAKSPTDLTGQKLDPTVTTTTSGETATPFRASIASRPEPTEPSVTEVYGESTDLTATTPLVVFEGDQARTSRASEAETVAKPSTLEEHLAAFARASSEEARRESEDALLTALSGGYEPAKRLEIAEALIRKVDVALHSLLAEHLEDIRAEALELGDEALVKEAERLLKEVEPKK